MIYYSPYNSYQPATMPQFLPQPQQQTDGVIKVNGRDSAIQYQLPPNSMSPALFDNNGKTFYIVSTDGTGTKTVEAFDYVPHVEQPPVQLSAGTEYVSRSEFQSLTDLVNKLYGDIHGIHGSVQIRSHSSRFHRRRVC